MKTKINIMLGRAMSEESILTQYFTLGYHVYTYKSISHIATFLPKGMLCLNIIKNFGLLHEFMQYICHFVHAIPVCI